MEGRGRYAEGTLEEHTSPTSNVDMVYTDIPYLLYGGALQMFTPHGDFIDK